MFIKRSKFQAAKTANQAANPQQELTISPFRNPGTTAVSDTFILHSTSCSSFIYATAIASLVALFAHGHNHVGLFTKKGTKIRTEAPPLSSHEAQTFTEA